MSQNKPTTPEELASFLKENMHLVIPSKRICPDHDTPWDYLCRGFFQPRDRLVWANRGGGKSKVVSALTCLQAIFEPGSQTILLGGSLEQSARLANYVRELLLTAEGMDEGESTVRRIRLKNGSVVLVLAQSQTAVRGAHVERIRCDEIELFDPGVWRAVQFCTMGRGSGPGTLDVLSTAHIPGGLMEELIASTQPDEAAGGAGASDRAFARTSESPGGFELVKWCLWEVLQRCDESRSCEQCPLADDCRGKARHCDGYFSIDDAIAIKTRTSRSSWESEMLCLGARRDHLVFREFDAAAHVATAPYRPQWRTYRAIDFGYVGPFVCLWVQLGPAGQVHVIDEYVCTHMPVAHHGREIARRDPPGKITATFVDPAGSAREATSGLACTEILASMGITCCWQASSILEGVELIRAALAPAAGPPRIRIDPKCRELIRSLRTYHYDDRDRFASESPVKDGPDHCIDALRYFFINRGRPNMVTYKRGY